MEVFINKSVSSHRMTIIIEMDVGEILPSENRQELCDSLMSVLPPCDYEVSDIRGSSERFLANIDFLISWQSDDHTFVVVYGWCMYVCHRILRITPLRLPLYCCCCDR